MPLPQPSPETAALITGASSGIGRELARGLAASGHNVVLVARRRERLEELAAEVQHSVRAEVVCADLRDPAERERLFQEVAGRGLTVDVLVNNAGFGVYAPFPAAGLEREFDQLDITIGAVVHLNAHYLPGMLERGRGAILNLSSTAGFQALPGNANYAAAKSFVLLHSEALWAEAKPRRVTVTAACPGPVRTEFQETSAPLFADQLPGMVWSTPERVAADCLRALERGKRTVIPGGLAVRLAFGPNRILPAGLKLAVSRRLMKRELSRTDAGPRETVRETKGQPDRTPAA